MSEKDFDVVQMRTELHEMPELGFHEEKTSKYVVNKLKELGLNPQTGIGGTGVVAYIDGTEPGPTVMVRAIRNRQQTMLHSCMRSRFSYRYASCFSC